MKDRLIKIIDVKSIVTLMLVIALIVIVIKDIKIDGDLFLLFSNVVTMVITYFFSRQKKESD